MSRKYTDIQLLRSLIDGTPDGLGEQAVLNVLTLLYVSGNEVHADEVFDAIAEVYSVLWSFGDE